MRREFFAIGMIALLVLTVFGGVAVTAKPADACAYQCSYLITPWRPSTWTGSCYNEHGTKIVDPGIQGLTSTSTGSTLATKDSAFEMTAGHGTNVAYLGVDWSLKPRVNWDAVKRQPVIVTALVSYTLSGNGYAASHSTVALRGGNPITSVNYKTIAQAGTTEKDPFPQKPYSVTASRIRVAWVTTLDQLSTGKGVGTVTVGLWTSITAATAYQNEASGDVTVSDITLTLR